MPQTEPSICPGSAEPGNVDSGVSGVEVSVPDHLRWWGFLIGLACVGILLAAWHLEPRHLPFGPESQLSLPGCGFRDRTGYPCPTCGMTTAWAKTVRGELYQGLQANIAGGILAIATVIAGIFGLATAAAGKRFYVRLAKPVIDLLSPTGWLYGLLGLFIFAWGWKALWAFIGQRAGGS